MTVTLRVGCDGGGGGVGGGRAHKTLAVREWLAAHPNVHFHFTQTYSCWLTQIELWFARIEREMLARSIFTSVADLRHKLLQYLRQYNTTCKPIAWAYNDPTRRIRAIRNSDAVH